MQETNVHIRIEQRPGRRWITVIYGLQGRNFDEIQKIAREMKKKWMCTGQASIDEEFGPIITLTGDHRLQAREYLIEQEISSSEEIRIMGYD